MYAKSASDKGHVAKLVCRATGAPAISFMWSRLGAVIQVEAESEADGSEDSSDSADSKRASKKYEVKTQMIDR